MNIALFASKHVGYEVARFLGENKEALCCLILDADDVSGCNSKILASSKVADEKVFYSNSIYEEHTLRILSSMDLDLIILAWWPYIVKKSLIQISRLGGLNFHPSYLPHNRGKHYNFWTLVENTPFGVTLHWIDEGVDSGDIAFQSTIEKSWEDTGETLYVKAQEKIVNLFKQKFLDIKSGNIPRIKQDPDKVSFHHSKELDPASRIELDKNYKARDLLNILRARTFPPHPAAWFLDKDEKYEIHIKINKVKRESGSDDDCYEISNQ